MTDTRGIVLDILLENENNGTFINRIINDVLDKYAYLDRRDRAFIGTLASGTVERRIALDFCIDSFSNAKCGKIKPLIREILRLSVYQILYMDHVPDSAACNEAVKLVSQRHLDGLKGFVNGVLRNIARNNEKIVFPDIETQYSCPKWIYGVFRRDHGQDAADIMIKASADHAPVYLRTDVSCISRDELIKELKEEGNDADKAAFPDCAVIIKDSFNPALSACFKKGLCTVQDISSQMTCMAAGVKEGMNIIDMCAAPGGKATHAAELMNGTGHVSAFDISDMKTGLIAQNIARLQLKNISTGINDATAMDESLKESADIVIADLPCSGLGVLRRKADLKYRIRYEDIEILQSLQRKILTNAVKYVRNGGRLAYSTCTVTKEETSDQALYIEQILGLKKIYEKQYLQGIDPCDGFYQAVFEK